MSEDFETTEGSEDESSNEEATGSSDDPDETHTVFKKRKHEGILQEGTETATPKRSKHKNELYKPPTAEELNNLKETENLYNNNLFRLQIEELVSEIKIKVKRKKNLSKWLDSFKYFLENIQEYKDILLSDIKEINKEKMTKEEKLINKLAKYNQIIKTDKDITLKFVKPETFKAFGLYENNALPGPNITLNINVTIPKSCFLLKDFLNNRYFCKHYYYLMYIFEQMKLTDINTNATLSFHQGNMLTPVLKVEPSNCDKTSVLIFVTPSEEYFKPNRCLPDQNNLKQDLFDTNINDDLLKNTPTVLYNSTLGHDVTLTLNNSFIEDTLKEQASVQEGIKLLCIWLKQRELNIGVGSFTEDLVVYFIIYLLHKKRINKYMSSYQVVRSFWSFLSTTDLEEEAISIGEASTEVLENFKKNFDVVLLDKSGCYNVCAFLNVEVYRKVKTESQFAIKLLDDNKNDSFHKLFLMKYPFFLQYDLVIDLTKSLPLKKYSINLEELVKNIGYKNLIIIKNISKIIQKGLSKRILNFVPRLELETDGFVFEKLFFGVNLNPDEAFNILELGPSLNDHIAAAEFRSFWGHLSSDRRFRDGSTNVAVHFKTNTIKAKRGIIRKILNFIIGEKLELKFDLHYDELEEILAIKKIVPSYPSGTNEETTLKIIQASDEIGKQLRSMQMSLKITGVQGITDTFCFADMFPQIPTNYEVGKVTTVRDNSIVFSTEKCEVVPRFIKPVECVLQLEHSSKWPNDLEALHHIKTSFYMEISRNLQSHKIISHVTPEFLDVFFEGLVFRYRLYVPKEVTLVKKSITENGITSFRDSLHSFHLENMLNVTPKIVGALKGVQSLYPSFGPGTALVKRWLRSQLIDDYYFPDIVIDLLNASLYLNNSFSPSNTPQISFLRFLKFFSEFDWNLQTVLVNFNEDITNEEIVALETKLQQNRDGYQPLYIITSFDQGLSVFTKYAPSKEILYRVKELTKISLNFIGNIHMGLIHTGIKELFIPNLEGYNLLIHLRSQMNSRRHEQIVFGNVTNRVIVEKYKKTQQDKLPIIDFNPVESYLKILRESYGKYAMFFHDSYGGDVIAVLWNPKVFESVDFKVTNVNAGMLKGDKIVFNMDAVIEDFYFLGKDLVKMIDKK